MVLSDTGRDNAMTSYMQQSFYQFFSLRTTKSVSKKSDLNTKKSSEKFLFF